MSARRCASGRALRRCWRWRWPPRCGCEIKSIEPKRGTTMNRRHFSLARALGVAAALVALGAAQVRADDYPTRPIRILVPYAPGGIADIAARIVGAKLTELWGQQVAVETPRG